MLAILLTLSLVAAQIPAPASTTQTTLPKVNDLFSSLEQKNQQGITGLVGPLEDVNALSDSDFNLAASVSGSSGATGSGLSLDSSNSLSSGTGTQTVNGGYLDLSGASPPTNSASADNKNGATHAQHNPLLWLAITTCAAMTFTILLV